MHVAYGQAGMLVAIVMFGTNYVPCRKYEIFDGCMFQWVMANGILGLGICVQLVFGGETLHQGLLGGCLWALSNFFVLPVVKMLGLGVGFSLYHGINLLVGYVVSRFGLFGAPVDPARIPILRDAATAVLLASLAVMVRVEPTVAGHAETRGPSGHHGAAHAGRETNEDPQSRVNAEVPMGVNSTFDEFDVVEHPPPTRPQPRRRHTVAGGLVAGHVAASVSDSILMVATDAAEIVGADMRRKPVYYPGPVLEASGSPAPRRRRGGRGGVRALPLDAEAQFFDAVDTVDTVDTVRQSPPIIVKDTALRPPGHHCHRLTGFVLALVAGVLAGLNAVPFDIWSHARPEGVPALSFLYAQTVGIYATASILYIVYGVVGFLRGRKLEKSPIRPAYISGMMWAMGLAGELVAIDELGMGEAYVMCAIGPVMVSALVSFFVFHEIQGRQQTGNFVGALLLQAVGVIMLSAGS